MCFMFLIFYSALEDVVCVPKYILVINLSILLKQML